MNLDSALQTFIVESRELLEEMENALLTVEQTQARDETVNAIFRAAHTIKGSAGLFSLDHIVAFTHVVESVLDQVRDGRIEVVDDLIVLLLSCSDHIGALIDAVESKPIGTDEATAQRGVALVAQLRGFGAGIQPQAELPAELSVVAAPPAAETFERIDGAAGEPDQWHISLRFGGDVLRNGMDPLSFIRYLGTLGRITGIVTLPDAAPGLEELDPEYCYLGFEIAFASDADKSAIENVFEFVRDDCHIRILPPNSRIAEYIRLIRELPEENARLGEILVRCGTLTQNELDATLDAQSAQPGDAPAQPIGAILVEQGMVQPAVVEAALAKQKHVKELKAQENSSIRVDADKLDQLINLVGELIIAAASANLVARRAQNNELQESTSTLSHLVEEVRDSALQLRMVKIGATFNRFQRVVHDVSRETGKSIELSVSGEETELDKTVVEKIADPLTHLVRNAIDHGIEAADARIARGKPAQGSVKLNAYHDSGCIVIEVSDDGGGLRHDKILEKAIERGLIEPGRNLADAEIYNLIFEPGFSTADQVTNLSGRGVGMDVVKRNIAALRGSVEVSSVEGAGTTVTVRLPLTLAIIDGFLVGLGKSVFVIPLDMIEECVEFSAEPGHDYTNLRGEVLPFIRLRELFKVEGAAGRRQSIVVLKHAGRKAGLVVDNLLGEFQTVIKPLGTLFNRVDCISGSSILGTGEVALILDVTALFRTIEEKDTRQMAA
ncbi:chemotaxis protein CheA [Noviherbaspirillum sedimenti]|uniref:Chemotaxis protein CheA n=1 Tax=Noviherbaspirillum sedimenti TaxID=2320865 RepID=A0A3A3FYH6_9BURK|nr:chemotaxis protein CheA [Noviherbaspirillum sedimenti]RJG01197.1 chemotaxis protein CheA [Noviherbaspirillum sedimenti]